MTASSPDERASLLEMYPEVESVLGSEGARSVGRRPLMPVLRVAPGPWRPAAGLPRDTTALAVLEGLLLRETPEHGGASLSGPGDLIEPWSPMLRWSAWLPLRVAIVGPALLSALRPWPDVLVRLLARALRQQSCGLSAQATAHRAGDDQRILGQLEHLAQRWGSGNASDVSLPLAVPAELLGRLAGVAPPAIGPAVRRLELRGQAVRQADGTWRLRGDPAPASAHAREETRRALVTAFARASEAYTRAVGQSEQLVEALAARRGADPS